MSEAGKTAGGNGQEDAEGLPLRYLELARLKADAVVNGRCRVERLIGKGGFGLVFAATDQTLKVPVALKFLDPQSLRDEKKFLRVQRETTLSRRIGDPRIVRIYSLESWRGIWFTVMERIAGRTLKERLKAEGPYSWDEFRPLFGAILQAVASLHAAGIIHRDLKPSNIMADGSGKVKILDFGLAKEIGDTEKTSSMGEIVGSPFYLSPEQIQGLELGVGSDIYQLGILLYQCLTGSYPFPDTTTMNLVLMHLGQKPGRLCDRGARVPEGVEFVVAKALAKRPRDRFRSAAEMAGCLQRRRAPLLQAAARRVPDWLRRAALGVAAALLGVAAYRLTYGSASLSSVRGGGNVLAAVNRFGRTVWRRDFAPFTVHDARLIAAPPAGDAGPAKPHPLRQRAVPGTTALPAPAAGAGLPVQPPAGRVPRRRRGRRRRQRQPAGRARRAGGLVGREA